MTLQAIQTPLQAPYEPFCETGMTQFLELLAQDCVSRLNGWMYRAGDREEFFNRAQFIENCITNRTTIEVDDYGNQFEIDHHIDELWGILPLEFDNFWEEDLDYIMSIVRDLFPDSWRP